VTQTRMTCREVNEFLGACLDQELEAEERGEFERHLGRCPVCVAYLENYRETIRLGRAALVENDPPERRGGPRGSCARDSREPKARLEELRIFRPVAASNPWRCRSSARSRGLPQGLRVGRVSLCTRCAFSPALSQPQRLQDLPADLPPRSAGRSRGSSLKHERGSEARPLGCLGRLLTGSSGASLERAPLRRG